MRRVALLFALGACALPATAAAAAPPPDGTQLTIAASGDFLIHSPVWNRARVYAHGRGYRFAPMFRRIRRFVARADIALCHVETPFSHGPPQGFPSFRTPVALARDIKRTGWDVCSTASNHTLDNGQRGVNTTIRTLNRVGLRHAGSYRSRRASRRLTFVSAKGVKVAFLSYTQLTNGQPIPHPWTLAMAKPHRILSDARRARREGANAVIVTLHWGNEFVSAPSPAQRSLARRLTRSRAITAIVGQHVHVVQPIRWMHGKPVVFGEGNLISNQTAACCPAGSQDGLIALLDLRVSDGRAQATRVRYLPMYVRHPDFTVLHARGASRRRTIHVAGRSKRVLPVR